jgi:hypothetical protein
MTARRLAAALITQIATAVGSLIGLASWDSASRPVKIGVGVLIAGLVVLTVLLEISAYLGGRPRGYRTPSRINRFMHDWMSQRGKVAIFSNDMSWVSENVHARWYEQILGRFRVRESPSIKALLCEKAAKRELILCLPRPNDLSRELAWHGAHVVTYQALGVVPEARFTIARYGQQDSEVAIGRRVNGAHRIETFGNGSHPAFALAEDLVRLAEAVHRAEAG